MHSVVDLCFNAAIWSMDLCYRVQAFTGDVRARDYAQLMDDVVSDWCKEICGTKQPAMLAQVRLESMNECACFV